jgi:hypothetical protein
LRGSGGEHGLRDGGVARSQRVEFAAVRFILRLGARHETEQAVGHTAACREHHTQAARGQCFEDAGDAAKTIGVRD